MVREIKLDKIQLAIFRTNKRLGMFERKYGMTSQEFAKKIENAELKESIDYIEWLGEIKTLALLDEKKNALTGVNFVDRGIF